MSLFTKNHSQPQGHYNDDLYDISMLPNQKIYRMPPSYKWINSDKTEIMLYKGSSYEVTLNTNEVIRCCVFQAFYFLDQEKEKPYKIFFKVRDFVSDTTSDIFLNLDQIKYIDNQSKTMDVNR